MAPFGRRTAGFGGRLVSLVVVLFLVSLVSFVLIDLLPGDPSTSLVPPGSRPEVVQQARHDLGLDRGPVVRYLRWADRAVHGDLGTAFSNAEPVSDVLRRAFIVSFELMIVTQVFALIVGTVVGTCAARRPGGVFDRVAQAVTAAVMAIPGFAVALVLLLVFAVHLHWFHATGFVHLTDDAFGNLRSLVMPAVALGLPVAGLYARILRAEMVATFASDHVLLSRGLGIPERRLTVNHVLRQSSFSLLALFGIETGVLLGSAVLVENIFALPGLGRLMIASITQREYLVVQGAVLVIGTVFVFANFFIDLASSWLDPRIRFESGGPA